MGLIKNGRVLFNEVPKGSSLRVAPGVCKQRIVVGYPEPGKTTIYDTTQTIDIENVPLDGGFLLKTLELSIDPYMRGRMRHPEKKSYSVGRYRTPPHLAGNINLLSGSIWDRPTVSSLL